MKLSGMDQSEERGVRIPLCRSVNPRGVADTEVYSIAVVTYTCIWHYDSEQAGQFGGSLHVNLFKWRFAGLSAP
jgi:hypothetical protein